MKVRFTKNVEFTPVWNGNKELPDADQVKVSLKVMEFATLQQMLDDMRTLTTPEGKPDAIRLLAKSGETLATHAAIHNLASDEGDVTIADLVKYPTFLLLGMEIMMKLVEISMPTEKDEGN